MGLIFLHIPKSGGTTLRRILRAEYGRDNIFYSIDSDPKGSEKKFIEQNRTFSLLAGHIHFGEHHYFGEELKYFSMVRHPVDRVISHYYYTRRRPENYAYPYSSKMTLEEYALSNFSSEMDNGQIRLLSGIEPAIGKCDRRVLEIAKENIDQHFVAVGLQEQFDKSLLLLMKKLHWKRLPLYNKTNVTPNKPEVSQTVRDKIAARNQYDMELYNWIDARFRKEYSKYISRFLYLDFLAKNFLYQRKYKLKLTLLSVKQKALGEK